MRVSAQTITFSKSEVIPWRKVRMVRMAGDKLRFDLEDGAVREFSNISPHTVEAAFRAFEDHLRRLKEEEGGPSRKKQRY